MVTKQDRPKEPKESVTPRGSLDHVLGEVSASGYQLLCERTKGCLLIGGQPIYDLMSVTPSRTLIPATHSSRIPGKFSKENIDALGAHIQQKRPALSTLLRLIFHVSEGEKVAREMGLVKGDSRVFDDFEEGVKDVLSMDQDEAVHDDCIWASMEWTWQEHTSRSHKKSRVIRPSVASKLCWSILRRRPEGGE